jgi:uncharacterized protein (TIGR02452 family)
MIKPIKKDFLHIQFVQAAPSTNSAEANHLQGRAISPLSPIRNYSDFTVWLVEKLPFLAKWMGIQDIEQDIWDVSLPSNDGLDQERTIYHLKASEVQQFQKQFYEIEGLPTSKLATDGKTFSLWLQTWGNDALQPLPQINQESVKPGAFVDVLNAKGYSINGKKVRLPQASKPEKHARDPQIPFAAQLQQIKREISFQEPPPYTLLYKDRSTEQAIAEGATAKIALNFANENHAGGGPGFHLDPETQQFVYDTPSARAQEESMCQKSDLMASLVQLKHNLKQDFNSLMIRSYYDEPFDSKVMAYTSHNHLFAVQGNHGFYSSHYLEQPRPVVFITSAAECYAWHTGKLVCTKGSEAYLDARNRIETHLLASAKKAAEMKQTDPERPVELILGAFGCGEFVPPENPDEYRKMIVGIYQDLLPSLNGFFDVITFAVPTFGSADPQSPAVRNYEIFKQINSSIS